MSNWTKQPAIAGGMGGCLCCGVTTDKFMPTQWISVGFGYAALERDGKPVWHESPKTTRPMTGRRAESMAAKDPDHDWRIVLNAPLRSATYQRHAKGEWVLIEKGLGFA